MTKRFHEIRDPVHVFVRLDSDERKVLDSLPVQRLRHVHQLALSGFVYPSASHKRFEHSLGVMELAGRVFDVITREDKLSDAVRESLPDLTDEDHRAYWRRVLRVAGLCHDIGHLPFSHAAEEQLLPDGWSHESLTRKLIESSELSQVWNSVTPPLRAEDIVKLAVGPAKAQDLTFTTWETILSNVIVGDAFGVDRMDYLLRDAHHLGVPYGRFDHYRLIDTLRILRSVPEDDEGTLGEPALGVEGGGLHTAEALMLARYFMYQQVYFHPVRLVYDLHLIDFLREWLAGGLFSIVPDEHLVLTDNEVLDALLDAARDAGRPGHVHAERIISRRHFRILYERNPDDVAIRPDAATAIFRSASDEFGTDKVKKASQIDPGGAVDFPVLARDGRVFPSLAMSEVLSKLPVIRVDYVYVDTELEADAKAWLVANRSSIIEGDK